MSIEERALHELHNGLEEVIGPDRAATLMSRLSPVSPSDVVTKSYLDQKLGAVDEKLGAVDEKLNALEERLTLTIRAEVATSQAVLLQQMNSQTKTMIFSLLMTLAMVTALLLGIR